jgi:thymidylate synthase
MMAEMDLGPIYGSQWVCFNGDSEKGNQLKTVIETIKKDPTSRRLVVSAWNPLQLDQMALPPCHVGFELLCYPEQGTMDLLWAQRSCDSFLGVPYDLASYALLLTLICKETGYTPGSVYGMLGSCHIYENHFDVVKEQLSRPTHKLPTIEIENWKSIWDWEYSDVKLLNYESEGALKGAIAV